MADIRPYREADIPALERPVAPPHEAVRPLERWLPPAASIIDAYLARLLERLRETDGTFPVAVEDEAIAAPRRLASRTSSLQGWGRGCEHGEQGMPASRS